MASDLRHTAYLRLTPHHLIFVLDQIKIGFVVKSIALQISIVTHVEAPPRRLEPLPQYLEDGRGPVAP